MSHTFFRFFKLSTMALVLLTGIVTAQKKPTAAVLELAGNGIDTIVLSTLTNRLRAELFDTRIFTIVERGQMEAILKEQGFQQTGCTDATCAVQVGQLLNAEYIIVGNVDHIGRVFSVNIRQISVANGAIINNVRTDCADCAIEDVMLKMLRQAVREIVGIDTLREQDVVTEQKGRKVIKCKTYKGGEAGTLLMSTIPPNHEVLIDGVSYGTGNMVIDYIPVGRHIIIVKKGKNEIIKTKITVSYGKTTEFDFVNIKNRTYHFCNELGLTMTFPKLTCSDYYKQFVNENNPGDTIRAPSGSISWFPAIPTLSFCWQNMDNSIGFIFGGMFFKSKATKTDDAGNEFDYYSENAWSELFMTYYRTIFHISDNFKTGIGLLCGLSYCGFDVEPKYGISPASQDKYLPIYENAYDDKCKYQQFLFGGPSLAVCGGYKILYFKLVNTLLLGMANTGSTSESYFSQSKSTEEFCVRYVLGCSIGLMF